MIVEPGYSPSVVPYLEGLELQRSIHDRVVRDEAEATTVLLEHPPVYTAGKRTEPADRPATAEVIDVDRGGRITWHGPGQLVGYPVVRLPDPIDVVAHVRRMEDILIDVCAKFGVSTGRVDGRSGVWVDPNGQARKVAAVGVRVSRGVTMHGFALNCDCDLSWFEHIVPCGITDAGVTSISAETGMSVGVADVVPHVRARLDQLDVAVKGPA